MSGETNSSSQDILHRKFKQVNVFAFDVDGVYTNGFVHLCQNGAYERRYHTQDGFATKYALAQGFLVWILTGGKDESIKTRFQHLGVQEIYLGEVKKEDTLQMLCDKHQVALENVCYMGDDIPDLASMKVVGLASCPKNACPDIRAVSHYISPQEGGQSCVRDVIECVLRAQEKWLVADTFEAST